VNPVPHFALGQWDAIGRMMYLSTFCASEGLRYLSHRPREAVPFASAHEAGAALGEAVASVNWALLTESAEPRERTLFVCEVTAATLHCAYPDGSGLATEYIRQTMEQLASYERRISTLRAFIQQHLGRLNGLAWDGGCYHDGPRVKIGSAPFGMNGAYVEPAAIARLWPDVKWKRKKTEYPPEDFIIYDWIAVLDGVELRINGAESIRIRPVDTGRDGTLVKLESGVAA